MADRTWQIEHRGEFRLALRRATSLPRGNKRDYVSHKTLVRWRFACALRGSARGFWFIDPLGLRPRGLRPVVRGGSGGSLEPPVEGSVRCACAHPKVQGTHRNTRGVWQGERGVLTGQRQQLRLLKTPQLIARLSRAVASGPVGHRTTTFQ